MTVTILCLFVAFGGVLLCGLLAEPWQRPRYDTALNKARGALGQNGLVTDAGLEALIANEMRREASDG